MKHPSRPLPTLLILMALVFPAHAVLSTAFTADMTADSINAAQFAQGELTGGQQSPLVAKLQILLDRHGMSPGIIDGMMGDNVSEAVSAFRLANAISGGEGITNEVWSE